MARACSENRGAKRGAIADGLIEMIGLGRFADAYPHTLSGGMQQRVAIARALANQPRVLLMDEPFGALDAQTRSVMQDNLLELRERIDATIVFVTHDIDEAILLADRVLIMSAGPRTYPARSRRQSAAAAVQRHHARSGLPRAEEGLSRPDPLRRPARLRSVERGLTAVAAGCDLASLRIRFNSKLLPVFHSSGRARIVSPWHES